MFKCCVSVTVLCVLCLLASASSSQTLPPADAPVGWKVTFADEFDTLDLSRWNTTFATGDRYLGGQGEQEIYVDPSYTGDGTIPLGLNPFSVSNGILTVRAERPSPETKVHLEGQEYTSGLLTTAHHFSQLYGYFEIRAKYPVGRGLWPGFWMLPSDGTWPPEIDIVELRGDEPRTLYLTVHYKSPGNSHEKSGFRQDIQDVSAGFHVYGVLWSPDYITWYVDNKRVAYTKTPDDVKKPMYLLIQLAVSGDWLGKPDGTTNFPARMDVDYVRVHAWPGP